MHENPFKFTGPLHPIRDRLVCISRQNELDKVITGIRNQEYWAILGPRQIGKTTFLRQLMHVLAVYHCVYLNLEISPESSEAFYDWMIDNLREKIPSEKAEKEPAVSKDYGPEVNFYNFLRTFRPEGNRKVVVFLDEIEKAGQVSSFLHTWRKVFHERNDQPELNKYTVVIAGAADLIALTTGPTSPFNIAQKMYLPDLNKIQARALIEKPLQEFGFTVTAEVTEKILEMTSGHPQLIQHLGYLLIQNSGNDNMVLSVTDLEIVLNQLYLENDSIKSLDFELKHNKNLVSVLQKILAGEKISYFAQQELAITGAGPIKQENGLCVIRNQIFQYIIQKVLNLREKLTDKPESASEFITTISVPEIPGTFTTDEEEKRFLQGLFDCVDVEINLHLHETNIENIELESREKLLLLYLAWKNYKAIRQGFEDWRKIPATYEYRLSSSIENNKTHVPEWEVFVQVLGKEPYGDDIRSWIFSLRRTLEKYQAKELIPSETGRGQGYLLKGEVRFLKR